METLDVSSRTDRGKRRRQNEDAILVRSRKDPSGKPGSIFLLAVADGMGGAAGGRVASGEAVRVLADEFDRYAGGDAGEFLRETFRKANAAVRRLAEQRANLQGMCTTLVVALVAGGRAWVANVGDSRAYLVQAGRIQRLTEDHSLVGEQVRAGKMTEEEAAASPQRNIITRCVGSEETVTVDLFPPFTLRTNDFLLLCSDGLSGVVSDEEIGTSCSKLSPSEAASDLVDLANDRGGPDNISVVIGRSYDAAAETVAVGRASRFRVGGPAMLLSGILVAVLLAGGLTAGVIFLAGGGDNDSGPAVVVVPTNTATPVATASPTATAMPVATTVSPTATPKTAETPTVAATVSPDTYYKVEDGDTWQGIADELGVTLKELYSANRDFYHGLENQGKDPLCLHAGDRLVNPSVSPPEELVELPDRLSDPEAQACARLTATPSPTASPTATPETPTETSTPTQTVQPSPSVFPTEVATETLPLSPTAEPAEGGP